MADIPHPNCPKKSHDLFQRNGFFRLLSTYQKPSTPVPLTRRKLLNLGGCHWSVKSTCSTKKWKACSTNCSTPKMMIYSTKIWKFHSILFPSPTTATCKPANRKPRWSRFGAPCNCRFAQPPCLQKPLIGM